MNDYIKREDAQKITAEWLSGYINDDERNVIEHIDVDLGELPPADVVDGDKAQKEIDYWHDKAQSYEQTILKLSLNKADVVEVVRCKDCKHMHESLLNGSPFETFCDVFPAYIHKDDYCSYGERADT